MRNGRARGSAISARACSSGCCWARWCPASIMCRRCAGGASCAPNCRRRWPDLDVVLTAAQPDRGAEDRRSAGVGHRSEAELHHAVQRRRLSGDVVCSGFGEGGLPVAIQLVGKPFQEATVLRVADAFEKATPFRARRPALSSALVAARIGAIDGPASASRLAGDRPHRRVRCDVSAGADHRVRRPGGGAVRLRPRRGDAAGERRPRRAAGASPPSSPPIRRCAPGISSPARSPSPAPSRATCWRSASRRSSPAPTGATTSSARSPARCRRISTRRCSATSRWIARAACACCPGAPELALAPFFGVMGVAPPPAFGTIASKEPRIHGGNMDNKELVAGSARCICRCGCRAPISRWATATACRATARSASPRWRCA